MEEESSNRELEQFEPEELEVGEETVVSLAWTAPEYEEHERSRRWFFALGGVALFFVLFGILTKSYFFIALTVLASVVILMYVKRTPKEISFAVTINGVHAGRKYYSFSELTSFHIFDHASELSLETKKHFGQFIRLPLGEADAGEVAGFLIDFLPRKEHQRFLSDEIARRIKI